MYAVIVVLNAVSLTLIISKIIVAQDYPYMMSIVERVCYTAIVLHRPVSLNQSRIILFIVLIPIFRD